MTWVIRILILLLVLRLLWRFVAGAIQGAGQGRERRPLGQGVPLVRDPVCGVHIPQSRALTARAGDRIHYFCSEQCRRAYRAGS